MQIQEGKDLVYLRYHPIPTKGNHMEGNRCSINIYWINEKQIMWDFMKLLHYSPHCLPFLYDFLLLSSLVTFCYPLPGKFKQLSKIFQLGSNVHLRPHELILHYKTLPSGHLRQPSPLPLPLSPWPCAFLPTGALSQSSPIIWSSLIFQSPVSFKKPSLITKVTVISPSPKKDTWNISPASSTFPVFTNRWRAGAMPCHFWYSPQYTKGLAQVCLGGSVS